MFNLESERVVTEPKIQSLPSKYDDKIESELNSIGYSLERPRELAGAVKKLSDFYTANPEGRSPWGEPWMRAASMAYYFPLNYARNRAVAREAIRVGFFQGLDTLFDFGSGMGSAVLALRDQLSEFESEAIDGKKLNLIAYDLSETALEHGRQLEQSSVSNTCYLSKLDLDGPFNSKFQGNRIDSKSTALVSSYALTELVKAPDWWSQCEALYIVEPSSREDARSLMSYRSDLIANGYSIWAPCTHHLDCPLLVNSEKDWCHDRLVWKAPDWFRDVEKFLPMKNNTITYSYLLARRSKRGDADDQQDEYGRIRVVGDMLVEKGKTRQLICRGPEREFLTWFPNRMSKGEEVHLHRGDLIRLHGEEQKNGNEMRIKTSRVIEVI